MISLVLASWLLALVAVTAGAEIADRLGPRPDHASAGQFFCDFWIGLAAILTALCFWALVAPLGYAGIVLSGHLVLRRRRSLQMLREALDLAGSPWVLAFLCLQFAMAWKMAQLTDNFDSYLYHYQLIDWYGEYGAVRGLPLVHFRLAFGSAWYALAGAFEFGPFASRAGNLPNFLAFSAGAAYLLSVVRKGTRATSSDLFWVVLFIALIAVMPIEVHSTSADFGVACLIGGAVWMVLRAPARKIEDPRYGVLVLWVAGGAAAVKESALAGLLGLGILCAWLSWRRWREWRWFGIAGLPLLSHSAMSLMTSGCLVTFAGRTCLDLPWAMTPSQMQSAADATRLFYRWSAFNPYTQFGQWLADWLPHERPFAMLALATLACGLAMMLASARQNRGWPPRTVRAGIFLTALIGIGACFESAPATRFAAIYLCLIPALACAVLGRAGILVAAFGVSAVSYLNAMRGVVPLPSIVRPQDLIAFAVVAALFGAGWLLESRRQREWPVAAALLVTTCFSIGLVYERPAKHPLGDDPYPRWLLPSRAPTLAVNEVEAIAAPGFTFHRTRPPNTNCGFGNLPCSLYFSGLRLLDPAAGIGGGFTLQSEPQSPPGRP